MGSDSPIVNCHCGARLLLVRGFTACERGCGGTAATPEQTQVLRDAGLEITPNPAWRSIGKAFKELEQVARRHDSTKEPTDAD